MAYIYASNEQRETIDEMKRNILQEKLNKKDNSKTTDVDVLDLLLKTYKEIKT